jgi:hypothetical protein
MSRSVMPFLTSTRLRRNCIQVAESDVSRSVMLNIRAEGSFDTVAFGHTRSAGPASCRLTAMHGVECMPYPGGRHWLCGHIATYVTLRRAYA